MQRVKSLFIFFFMDLKLIAEDNVLIEKFKKLSSRDDVADMLEVSLKTLNFFLYINKRKNYKSFSIKKKNGGERIILAPVSSLKIIQKKLYYILSLVYTNPRPSIHGFLSEKSIITNASEHVRKNLILNVDLENFFGTITFPRVFGLLKKPPYNVSEKAAVVLAQICTHEGVLPQGAPTSPIISNMILSRMDRELQSLARENSCYYTRYADDITFSTTQRLISKEIVDYDNTGKFRLGLGLINVINKNKFKINSDKIKFNNKRQRQEVTGLIVNKKVNIKRGFIRQVRAMLHALYKFGKKDAEREYYEKYVFNKNTGPFTRNRNFLEVVKGKLNFIKMVKGFSDPLYVKLAKKFNTIYGSEALKYFDLGKVILVLSNEDDLKKPEDIKESTQGTGFF